MNPICSLVYYANIENQNVTYKYENQNQNQIVKYKYENQNAKAMSSLGIAYLGQGEESRGAHRPYVRHEPNR
jgi:hypothetical protein